MEIFKHFKFLFLLNLLGMLIGGPSNVFSEDDGVKVYDSSRHSPLDLVSRITDEESSNLVPSLRKINPTKNLNEIDDISNVDKESRVTRHGSNAVSLTDKDIERMLNWQPPQTVQIILERSLPPMSDFQEAEDPFAEEHPEYPQISDPLEEYNRFMYSVNDGIFEYFLAPVAQNYETFVHEEIRLAMKNLFNNASSAVKLVSSLLQGDLDKSVRVLGRFLLNTTIGLGGLFDVAGNYYEVEDVNEDFSQMLGHYGVGTGPYLVLPFLGPASGRNVFGRLVDSFLSPTILFSPSFVIGAGITLGDTVNSMSFNYQGYKDLKQDAVDPYISLRDFQHQYREKLVHE